MNDTIHIVCLDAPSPPDYGGVFDLYYKIPALAALGKKIILHYFQYKEGRNAKSLEKYCSAIYSYPRSSFLKAFLKRQSYIVYSRINQQLINRLNGDNHPVLLEGIHCTGVIPFLRKNKKIIIRIHNNEAIYYRHLADTEQSILKRWYFKYESQRLEQYQHKLPKEATYLFVSQKDQSEFEATYDLKKTSFLPCFLPWLTVNSSFGKGDYCIYHGNLSVPENKKAAEWLMNEVFTKIDNKLIIAGKGGATLESKNLPQNIRIIDSPTDDQLNDLLHQAHIHLAPSFNATGVKLKLLHALFEGRFCITNRQSVEGSGIEQSVFIADTALKTIDLIQELTQKEFTKERKHEREKALILYSNTINAEKLNSLL